MASTYLTRTPSNNYYTEATFSFWVKRSGLSADIGLFGRKGTNQTAYGTFCHFNIDDSLLINFRDSGGTSQYYMITNRKFRDTSAWYHIHLIIDGNNATQSDRSRLYVNGVRENDFALLVNPASTGFAISTFLTTGEDFTVGRSLRSQTNTFHNLDGSMTHFNICTGTAYEPTEFGQYDANGVWTIKTSPSVTYGTNGFFILKDGNSVTDQSGNGNNFTVAGGTLTKTEDSPSNVFATLNALDVFAGTPAGLINGNNTYNKTATGIGTNGARVATIAPSSGKWYWEFKPADTVSVILGFARTDHLNNTGGLDGFIGEDVGTFGIKADGSKIIAGTSTPDSYSFTANDVIGFAMDLDNNKFYAHKNGTYYNSGDPTSGATGTGAIGNITAGNNYAPLVQNNSYTTANVVHCNFGNGYFGTTAVASAGTNASGNGIFEYDVPTGYTALSTKGLNL